MENSLVPRSKHAGAHIPLRKNARNCRHTLRVRRLLYITSFWRRNQQVPAQMDATDFEFSNHAFLVTWTNQQRRKQLKQDSSKVGKMRKIGIPRRGKPEGWSWETIENSNWNLQELPTVELASHKLAELVLVQYGTIWYNDVQWINKDGQDLHRITAMVFESTISASRSAFHRQTQKMQK